MFCNINFLVILLDFLLKTFWERKAQKVPIKHFSVYIRKRFTLEFLFKKYDCKQILRSRNIYCRNILNPKEI